MIVGIRSMPVRRGALGPSIVRNIGLRIGISMNGKPMPKRVLGRGGFNESFNGPDEVCGGVLLDVPSVVWPEEHPGV